MGPMLAKLPIINSSLMEDRVPYDEEGDNGYVIGDKYIPEELILELLCQVDYKTLLNCQLVCKRWNALIKDYVWKKKAEMTLGHSLPVDHNVSWAMYYYVCDKRFYKNLIKNHSGKKGPNKEWIILDNGGNEWKVECPPVGISDLPDDPVFDGEFRCFVTSYSKCSKYIVIDLVKEGFHEHILDTYQPPIQISEYYGCRWDCSAKYSCVVQLLADDDYILTYHEFKDEMVEERQDQWFKFEHTFKEYGSGLRKVKFYHAGRDRQFWRGHYGAKMAGACIKLELP